MIVPPEAVIVVLVAVMEEAFNVEPLFIVIVLLEMGRALEAVKLLAVPSMTMLLLFFIVVEPLDLIVLPLCMVKLLPSDTKVLSMVMLELLERTTLLLVKVDPGVVTAPLLPETSIKEEVKSAGVLLVWKVTLEIWIESLVKLAALKVTPAFTCIRTWLTVEVPF